MSGVYIKGMEMPTGNDELRLIIHSNGQVIISHKTHYEEAEAVPVPPHGDLIERDALRASIRESIDECHKWADEVDKDTMMYARISQSLGTFVECSLRVKAAPIIIPAEAEHTMEEFMYGQEGNPNDGSM